MLFEEAKRENLICMLPTGSGKTLVAAMLVQHMLDQQELQAEESSERKRKVVFLVNTITLVDQQHKALTEHLDSKYKGT